MASGSRTNTTTQCRFVLLALEEMFFDEEFLQDAVVDFVVTVYPRIVSEASDLPTFDAAVSFCPAESCLDLRSTGCLFDFSPP